MSLKFQNNQVKSSETHAICGLGLIAVFVFFLGLFAGSTPYLHDFGEWMFQGKVLALKLLSPDDVTAFQLAAYPVPNSLAIFILSVLNMLFSPMIAGKLFLGCLIAAWCIAAHLFCKRFFPKEPDRAAAWLLIVCLAGFSSFFWYGYVGYQLGALVLLMFLALYRASMSLTSIVLFSVLAFFSHAMIFLQFGLIVFLAVIVARYPLRHALALIPATVLSLLFLTGRYLAESSVPKGGAAWNGWLEIVVYKAGTVTMLGPFKNFILPDGRALLESYPALYWSGVLANVIVTGLVAYLILLVLIKQFKPALRGYRNKDAGLKIALYAFSVITVVLYLLAPHHFFGMENPGIRLVIPLLFTVLSLLSTSSVRLPYLLVYMAGVVTVSTVIAYAVTLKLGDNPAQTFQRNEAPPAHVRKSVLAFNEWLYRNTRYSYYNYRIFAFEKRLDQLRHENYTDLVFRTGPLVQYQPATTDQHD